MNIYPTNQGNPRFKVFTRNKWAL